MTKKLKKRIISKLEVKGPNLIKGVMFDGLRSLGLAHNFSTKYYEEGIDELIYQDVIASLYLVEPKYDQIKKISNNTFIPFTVAGGITKLDQIKKIFDCGADKVAINTGAINDVKILENAAKEFGSQSVVSSIEVNSYFDYSSNQKVRELWIKNGKEKTDKNFIDWIKQVQDLGAGEIIITMINLDGLGKGPDLDIINEIDNIVKVPLIYSGGIGSINDVEKIFITTNVDAVCAASLFHYYYYNNFDINPFKNFNKLRCGKNIDIGNYEFINNGYGDVKYFYVKPASITQVKKKLISKNINIRVTDEK
jgi:cyclase